MDERKCFLCGRNGAADPLERHHVFGGPNRDKSEKYGLVVLLCGNRCHRNGKFSAHKCADTRIHLRKWAQKKVMKEQGWSVAQFRAVFGKNYLSEEDNNGES